ncbi:MAG: hypothetical protein ACRDHB_02895 [Actinomycetota bacterium]
MAQTKRSTSSGEHAPESDRACPVGFCPVGLFLTAAGSARPEAVEHLVAAGREFMLALSAVINSRVDDLGRTSQLEKIELE